MNREFIASNQSDQKNSLTRQEKLHRRLVPIVGSLAILAATGVGIHSFAQARQENFVDTVSVTVEPGNTHIAVDVEEAANARLEKDGKAPIDYATVLSGISGNVQPGLHTYEIDENGFGNESIKDITQ